jgi:hypothetical protein
MDSAGLLRDPQFTHPLRGLDQHPVLGRGVVRGDVIGLVTKQDFAILEPDGSRPEPMTKGVQRTLLCSDLFFQSGDSL